MSLRPSFKSEVNALLLGITFLTRFPTFVLPNWSADACRKAVKYFPLIGVLLGLAIWLPLFFSQYIASPFLRGFMLLVYTSLLTGGIHYDGFSDTMDGLLSGRPPEKMLAIMRDSNIGVFGATTLILLLLGKFVAYSTILSSGGFSLHVAIIFLIVPIWARVNMSIAIVFFPYARKEGLGKAFSEASRIGVLVSAGAVVVALFLYLRCEWQEWFYPLLLSSSFAVCFAQWAKGKLGGLTGDVYGAIAESSELLLLLYFACL